MTATAHPVDHSRAQRQRARLVAEIARARDLLQCYAEGADPPPRPPADETDPTSTVDRLARLLGLSDFELDVLMLTAAVELDAEVAALAAAVQGGVPNPTFGLAVAALPAAHWDALGTAAPLRRWRLIELGRGSTLTARPLHLDEHVLHHLTGLPAVDDRLAGTVSRDMTGRPPLPPSYERVAVELHGALSALAEPALVRLSGEDADDALGVACRLAELSGLVPLVVRVAALPGPGPELALLSRLLDRESLLLGGMIVLDPTDTGEETASLVHALTGLLDTPVVVVPADGTRQSGRALLRRAVPLPGPDERRRMWTTALRGRADDPEGPLARTIEGLAEDYRLGAGAIGTVVREALTTAAPAELPGRLRAACRQAARAQLEGLAERIEPQARWDDLVLPAGPMTLLHDIARQVRHRTQVHERWGFGRHASRGTGVTALFTGESGTGKTLAAEVIAAELGLDLYRIDLAGVVNKYVGETEKNLRRVFDAAEAGGAVLLFDEADALFGRRGEIRDGHDRYANLEVAYLLQRMESYRGLALLTTNLRSALDRAFLRRLRFVVQFPFPDEPLRTALWRHAFPADTPCAGIDFGLLAQMHLTGGSIHAIALGAAFAAADEGSVVVPAHILRSAQVEYVKHDRAITDAERRGWA
ncbi:ATP-binding protein [Streptomyces sp. NPDC001652]|uniref:ATP-binding protein n=1 Tax=Streptomyces sp. NPDC001652 TaxID=3154393 RepID=UPI003318CAC0